MVRQVVQGQSMAAKQVKNAGKPLRWTGPPSSYFFMPGQDPGLTLLAPFDRILTRVPGARVRQYACSEHAAIQRALKRNLESRWTDITPAIFEIGTVPVVAHDVTFRAGTAEVGGKCLMNGASGDRAYARYLKHNPGMPGFRRANRMFAAGRQVTQLDLPVQNPDTVKGMKFAIECRNRTNYYHFMTEALPNLVHAARLEVGKIIFHCRNDDPSGFSARYIEALFPEFAGKVSFVAQQRRYDQVALAFNARHLLYASGDPRISHPLQDVGDDTAWRDLGGHVRRRKFAFKNSYDVSMRLLRERVVSMMDPTAVAAAPRRIWVRRDPRNANVNQRSVIGEELLAGRLAELEFETVFFERLTPLEQLTLIRGADVVVAAHGAFFANMMFARPETHFIEIGSLQTQMHRWGDFLGNAHSAGCRYSMVFADTASEDPGQVSTIMDGLIGVRVGARAVDLIADLV